MSISFSSYPKKWGDQLHYTGKPQRLKDGDLETLEKLRERFEDRREDVLSWKFDLKPIQGEFNGLAFILSRLWANGLVVKFSGQFHTVHGNPEYIKWLIWEEEDGRSHIEWDGPRAPGYIV